ncbi:MAG: bifunctional heptose 7-phosphate kinase/heptose 1-phosphate adenyltransferase [Myxococcota bacterium]
MSAFSLTDLKQRIDAMASLRVLVVGDVLLDEYRVGDVERVSPEAPVPIVRVADERSELGGAGNVARGIVSLGAACRLAGVVGADAEGASLRRRALEVGVEAEDLLVASDRPTSHKLRVVARGQQMLRLDRELDHPLPEAIAQDLRERVESQLANCDALILQDYDKGVFGEGDGPSFARWVIEAARARGCFVAADPKRAIQRFRGASLVKPNFDEARAFVPGQSDDLAGRLALLEKLQHELGGAEIVMTRGASGMSALDAAGGAFELPTRALEVYDVQGAGDTSIAALTLCRAAGASLREACLVANAAAAVVVEKVGTAAVTRDELVERLPDAIAAAEAGKRERT